MPKSLGRYQIVRELGKGAMGLVYEGLDPKLGRRVAIKTARRDVMESSGRADEMMERFLREARAAGSINHPYIITIYDTGEENDMAYIAMEIIDSGDLQDVINKKRRLSAEEIVEIGCMICTALATAHDQGIVHRDIKPANIMVMPDGTIKITDFGIAHVSDSNLTQEGSMIGTPHFMSPEQFMGQKVDGRSDLFSVALILYEMLTGEKPFTGEAFSTVMHKVIKENPTPPKELNFAVTDCLNAVILKALSKNPNQRYQNGRVMAAALRESLAPNPNPTITQIESPAAATAATAADTDATLIAPSKQDTVVSRQLPDSVKPADLPRAMPLPEPGPPPQPAKGRNPAVPIVAGVGVLLFIMAGVLFMWSGNKKPPEPPTAPASPPISAPAPVSEHAFTEMDATVWLANDKAAWDAATDGEYKLCDPNGKADIRVTDPSGAVLAQEPKFDTGKLRFSKPSERIKVTYSQDGYEETIREYVATKPGETCKAVIALKKKSF